MQENNTEKEIEKWYVTHMKNNFLYYLLFGIFITIFSYVFYVNIQMHNLYLLLIYAFTPSILVTLFSFLLLRGYFLVFFGLTIFMTPALVTLFILFTFKPSNSAPSTGYVLYTNNLTNKCNLAVLDYKDGAPWFATRGCLITENSKPTIQKFIKSGGSGMRWQNACQMLRFSSNNLVKGYDKVISKNSSFDIVKSLNGEIVYATTTDEYILVDKLRTFQKIASQNLSDFKGDVPGMVTDKKDKDGNFIIETIKADNVLDLCAVKHTNLGSYDIYSNL